MGSKGTLMMQMQMYRCSVWKLGTGLRPGNPRGDRDRAAPHLSQRPAGERWRDGPRCREGSWRRRWRCRCRRSPHPWWGWSRPFGKGSPRTPVCLWTGPCCPGRPLRWCSGRSGKDKDRTVLHRIGSYFQWLLWPRLLTEAVLWGIGNLFPKVI